MRTITKLLTFCALALVLSACSRVEPGHVGVKVYLLGGDKGVDVEELGVGRYWVGINEELYTFPTFTQNVTWTKAYDDDQSLSFQTKEGLVVNADLGISYHIRPDRATDIFQKYRKGIDEITDVYLRNMVRDALVAQSSKLAVESVYGEGKVALLNDSLEQVKRQAGPIGIEVESLYWVGNLRLPDVVVKAVNSKIEASQKAQQRENELKTAEAEAAKQVATAKGEAESILAVAKAQAQANELINKSLTETLVKYKGIEKWDGKLPQITGTGTIPMVSLSAPAT